MPMYGYRNTKTGEEWTEFRPMSQMEDGVGGDIELMISMPAVIGASGHSMFHKSKETDKFMSDIVQKKMNAHNPTGLEIKL